MKKAIVMGATSGIGMEVAKLLAQKGWQVGIAGRRVERLEEVMQQSLEDHGGKNGGTAWTSIFIVRALDGKTTRSTSKRR